MILMITGCRDWKDEESIETDLVQRSKGFSVIVGDCPTGVDEITRRVCEKLKIKTRVFRADWKAYGPGAGPIRNSAMIADGKPDKCVAFWDGVSRGTMDCIKKAVAAGIPTTIVPKKVRT